MDLRIQLLGTIELQAEGQSKQIKHPKERCALAALAWDAGRTLSTDTLIHRIWDDFPPDKPRQALQVLISRIRKAFGCLLGPNAPSLVGRSHTYVLEAEPDTVDVRHYLSLITRARSLADTGQDHQALATLEEARVLWRGEPLAGLPGSWAQHIRDTVAEKNLASAILHANVALRLGRYADAVADLRPFTEQHPTAESLLEQLALALHGLGRTAEASQLLQHTRRRLLQELGAEPGEALQRVHRAILRGTPVRDLITSGSTTGAPSHGEAPPAPDNLPPPVRWINRRDEFGTLAELLARPRHHRDTPGETPPDTPVAAVTGMPGAGKTALAVHTAHQLDEDFPDGRVILDMRGHAPRPPMPPEEALTALLRLFGVLPGVVPQRLEDLLAHWRSAARHRRFVMILDDVADSAQIKYLIPRVSQSAVLVTCRHQLTDLPGLRTICLGTPSSREATELFQHFLGQGAPNDPAASELVQRCEYLPLAIELAASRLLARPSWRVSDLLERFDRVSGRLPELRDGQRHMVTAFEVSYNALTPSQQLIFRRVGLHFGSQFGTPALAALSGESTQTTEDALEELLRRNLVTEPSANRYRPHDLVREFARGLTQHDPDAENRSALRRLVQFYLRTADQADRSAFAHRLRIPVPRPVDPSEPGPPKLTEPLRWLSTEGPNLLATLEWLRSSTMAHEAALFTHVLAGFLNKEVSFSTTKPQLLEAVSYWERSDDRDAYARALLDLTQVSAQAGDYSGSIDSANRALAISKEVADLTLEAEALHHLSICLWYTAEHATAYSHQQRALHIREEGGDPLQQGRSLNMLGMICLHMGRLEESLTSFQSALFRFREFGDELGQSIVLNNLAELYRRSDNPEQAEYATRQALEITRELGDWTRHAIFQMNLATTLHKMGRSSEVLNLYYSSLPVIQRAGDQRSEALLLDHIGQFLHSEGESEEALSHHASALNIAQRIHIVEEEAKILKNLALAELATGRRRQGEVHLDASRSLKRELKLGTEAQGSELPSDQHRQEPPDLA